MTTIDSSIFFHSKSLIANFHLCELTYQQAEGKHNGISLKLRADHASYEKIETAAFFNNALENRLDIVEGGFNPDLNVFINIDLRQEHVHLLPTDQCDLTHYFQHMSKDDPLLQENFWNATFVWTEIHLSPTIGGGVIKVGYKTRFSTPANRIDLIKRQGSVSKAITTALIENNFPVYFDDASQCFALILKMEDAHYHTTITPDNQHSAMSIQLAYTIDIPPHKETQAIDLLSDINKEIIFGEFFIEKQKLTYCHAIQVAEELISDQWVSGALLASGSVMHHYAKKLEELIGQR
ncbi:YbjN domain-containing protein [Solimicrobium silvestre]|uniref:Uncharacterized protein n=1 Tax=Solimicrobium silvestre TaxID=2099400 RepID=A0A2S9H0H2_9BURK|nr:YbjN domain-containing protein [Solimicrobium silvestre]PRC93458.1 hypothetical protein S2091_1845 [Solimicrobium silvestre]